MALLYRLSSHWRCLGTPCVNRGKAPGDRLGHKESDPCAWLHRIRPLESKQDGAHVLPLSKTNRPGVSSLLLP